MASLGLYNSKYFENNPEESNQPGLLYVVVLVDKKTGEREAVKIGITKGTSFRNIIKRSLGFGPYEARIQKEVKGTLEDIFYLEQYLHELHLDKKYVPKQKFGGRTECFGIQYLKQILETIPNEP